MREKEKNVGDQEKKRMEEREGRLGGIKKKNEIEKEKNGREEGITGKEYEKNERMERTGERKSERKEEEEKEEEEGWKKKPGVYGVLTVLSRGLNYLLSW